MYSSTTAETRDSSKSSGSGASHLKKDIQDAANDARKVAGRVGEDLKEVAEDAGHTVREFVDSAEDEIKSVAEGMTSEIRRHPVQASLVALGIGFIVGTIMRR